MTALIICTVVFAVVALAFLGFAIYDHISWRKANRSQSPNEKSREESSVPSAASISQNAASPVVSNAQEPPAVPQQFCAGCGNPVSGKFCAKCGTPVPQPSKPVKALAPLVLFVLTCVFGALVVLLYMFGAYFYDIADFHLSIIFSCFALPLLCVYPVAFWLQNKKPVLSGFLYLLPISALFFIAVVSFDYTAIFTPILAILSVAFLIASACTVKNHKETTAAPRKPRAAIAVLLCASVLVSGSGLVLERISNARRQAYLNDLSEFDISLTKEELDFIDPDYVLRRGLHGELSASYLARQKYVPEPELTAQSGVPTYDLKSEYTDGYPFPVFGAYASLNGTKLDSYSVYSFSLSRSDASVAELLRILTKLSGRDVFKSDNQNYTVSQILEAPAPAQMVMYAQYGFEYDYYLVLNTDGKIDLTFYIAP